MAAEPCSAGEERGPAGMLNFELSAREPQPSAPSAARSWRLRLAAAAAASVGLVALLALQRGQVLGGERPAAAVLAPKSVLERRGELAQRVPCPFLAALYKRGILDPDEMGRVTSLQLKQAMEAVGSTEPNAVFPALGTARFSGSDMHQAEGRYFDYGVVPAAFFNKFLAKVLPSQTYQGSRLYLNLMTMNAGDKCVDAAGNAELPSEFPCNANPQHVQHGYSTTVRDTRYDKDDPTREKRFQEWISPHLVLDPNVSHNASERVMTFEGFAGMLRRMATEGDQSSEWSLRGPQLAHEGSNIAHYHPSVTAPEAEALYHWGAYLAWSGLWDAFGIPNADGSKGVYMTETDLRTLMLESDLPKDWEVRPLTMESVGFTMVDLRNHSIPTGDSYSAALAQNFPLSQYLPSVETEWRYTRNYMNTDTVLGFFKDNIINPMPSPAVVVV